MKLKNKKKYVKLEEQERIMKLQKAIYKMVNCVTQNNCFSVDKQNERLKVKYSKFNHIQNREEFDIILNSNNDIKEIKHLNRIIQTKYKDSQKRTDKNYQFSINVDVSKHKLFLLRA